MPFSFQLLLEFFFPGLILFIAIVLSLEPFFSQETYNIFQYVYKSSSMVCLTFIFICGLISYFLGATINGVSNGILRTKMSRYRRAMIRRKLGLIEKVGIYENLASEERNAIESTLPRLKSNTDEDKLNELYTAARNYASTISDRTGQIIDYHWSLVRLSRATVFPLLILSTILLIRFFILLITHNYHHIDAAAFFLVVLLFCLDVINYRYREKFLIYTVFDLFFINLKSKEKTTAANSEKQ